MSEVERGNADYGVIAIENSSNGPVLESQDRLFETSLQVCERADRAIAMALQHMQSRDVVLVGHGHFSRAVLTRWIEQPVYEGIRFAMPAASIAVCGYEHGIRQIAGLGITGNPHPP